VQICNALQFLKKPDEKILAWCTSRLDDKTNRDSNTATSIMEALIVWSTPESLKLYDRHLEYSDPLILLLHRDKPEILKLYVDSVARISAGRVPEYVSNLLRDTYSIGRSSYSHKLPPWPEGPEGARIADILETLRTKASLNADQAARLEELARKLRASMPPATTPRP
jgi:hypothetical protein